MLKLELKKFIDNSKHIIFLCIGNDMRGDDSAGPLIAQNLSKIFKKNDNIEVINAGTVPENYTGLIRQKQPSHIILIDAVEMKMNPGSLRLVQSDEISNYSVSTHAMPLSFMIKYIESFTDAKIILIGIQPKNLEMSKNISEEVNNGIKELNEILIHIFQEKNEF